MNRINSLKSYKAKYGKKSIIKRGKKLLIKIQTPKGKLVIRQ